MIYHVVSSDNDWPPKEFFRSWAPQLRDRFRTIHTHELAGMRSLPKGTYIFGDFERQTQWQVDLQAQVADQLHAAGCRVLNHPSRVLRRYELLTKLAGEGINDYAVHRVLQAPDDLRFPVFLRMDNDHHANLSPLIHGWDELRTALTELALAGAPSEHLLVVQFSDTSDPNGGYRKYSYFRFGEAYVPRHLIFGNEWVLKVPDKERMTHERIAEEREFLEGNTYLDVIREAFELAGIELGRVDFGVKDGRPQIWEINTNPIFLLSPDEYHPLHMPAQHWFAANCAKAVVGLDSDLVGQVPIRISAIESQPSILSSR